MARFKSGSIEAQNWARKMRELKEAKNPVKAPEAPDFLVSVIRSYFPDKEYKILPRDNAYQIEILISEKQEVRPSTESEIRAGKPVERVITERDVRGFVVNQINAKVETENWCKRIRNNLEGKKPEPKAVSMETTMGIREFMARPSRKLPQNLGNDSEFFFRE